MVCEGGGSARRSLRVLVVGAVMAAVAWFVADAVGYGTPAAAILAVIVGGAASVAVGIVGLRLLPGPRAHGAARGVPSGDP